MAGTTFQREFGSLLSTAVPIATTPEQAVSLGQLGRVLPAGNLSVLTAAVANASGTIIELGAYTYTITSLLQIAGTGALICGVPGKTKITSSTLTKVVQLLTCTNVIFRDIIFETTLVDAAQDVSYGVVFNNSQGTGTTHNLSHVEFHRCTFTCPGRNTNGLKIAISSSSFATGEESTASDILIEDCDFLSCGRMGVEIVNTKTATPVAYRRFKVYNSRFINCGLSGSFGMGVSLGGLGYECEVDGCLFDNCLTIGLENSGASDTRLTNNRFKNQPANSCSLGISNATVPVTDIYVAGNKDLTPATAKSYLVNATRCTFSGNTWQGSNATGTFYFSSVVTVDVFGDKYISSGAKGLVCDNVTGPVTDINWFGGEVDHSGYAGSGDSVYFTGSTTTRNKWYGLRLTRGASSNVWTQANSANDNLPFHGVLYASGAVAYDSNRFGVSQAAVTGAITGGERDVHEGAFVQHTGTPAAGFTYTIPRGNYKFVYFNATTQTATVTNGTGVSATVLAGEKHHLLSQFTGGILTGVTSFLKSV